MNNILLLKGKFEHKNNQQSNFGNPKFPSDKRVSFSIDKIIRLVNELKELNIYWEKETVIKGALIEIKYVKIVAKSNRVHVILKNTLKGQTNPNMSIVGVKFSDDDKHVITHYTSKESIQRSIQLLNTVRTIIETEFNGKIAEDRFNNDESYFDGIDFNVYNISKTTFQNAVIDVSYIESFSSIKQLDETNNPVTITIYKTELEDIDILLSVPFPRLEKYDDLTYRLLPDQYNKLIKIAPYLIAMSLSDFSLYEENEPYSETKKLIESPNNEPIIGVIDTPFDNRVYFSDWVDSNNVFESYEGKVEYSDCIHGTQIDSILVDGERINPWLADNCGRFRVRHFGVCLRNSINPILLSKKIKKIVLDNPDIHVWNLSLGSNREINKNYISLQGAILDELQYLKNTIFVVAGTNDNSATPNGKKKIGAPADSINSIVVNSINTNNESASYSRRGPVLSFFNKPDCAYFGGDKEKGIAVCSAVGESFVKGTSFAAPWIARKMSYLIDKIGLTREVAKALLLDSAAGWNHKKMNENDIQKMGYGIVPIKIDDILETKNDEIKFVLYGTATDYTTYTYNLPIPMDNDKFPFKARATMVYFPRCVRTSGVDYTCTELNLNFGRIDSNGKIKTINENNQDDSYGFVGEKEARAMFRKWDNVKHISQIIKDKMRPLTSYNGRNNWGLEITSKERVGTRKPEINFGVVITLKEINGVNRINDFISQCFLSGWLVQRIVVEESVDIYAEAQNDIKFE